MKFSHIIEKLVEENITHTHLEQGRKFEKLTQKILQLAPQFQSQFKDVYLWSEFSDEFGIHQKDTGVDLMAQTHDGQWVAIQCKCFDSDYKLRLADLKGFLGIKSIYDSEGKLVCEIVQSLLFHTCKEVSAEVLKALKQSQNSASLEGKAYDITTWRIWALIGGDLNMIISNHSKFIPKKSSDLIKSKPLRLYKSILCRKITPARGLPWHVVRGKVCWRFILLISL